MRSSRCRRRNGFCAAASTFSAALSTVIETRPFVSRTSSASSAENGVGLKYARHVTESARPRSTSPRRTAIECFSSGRLNSSSAKKIGTRPMPRPFADSTVCLDLGEHRAEVAVRVLAHQVRGRAVRALHRAADPRPHRERVRGRVERIALRGAREDELVGVDAPLLAAPYEPRNLLQRPARADRCKRVLAGADHAPLDVEVLEALLGTRREPSAAGDEGRLRTTSPRARRSSRISGKRKLTSIGPCRSPPAGRRRCSRR